MIRGGIARMSIFLVSYAMSSSSGNRILYGILDGFIVTLQIIVGQHFRICNRIRWDCNDHNRIIYASIMTMNTWNTKR